MSTIAESLGLCRSLAIYYGRPWKTAAARRFYRNFARPADLVFDIGAHVGSRARVFSALGARVVAVEPQPLFFKFLAKTLPPSVILLDCAIGAEIGNAELHISFHHPTVSTLSTDWISSVKADAGFRAVRWDDAQQVAVTTLDAMIADYGVPSFCKIDVEGFEANVLRGLSQPIALVAFEYIPAAIDRAESCLNLLSALGDYRFNRVRGESFAFSSDRWLTHAEMKTDLQMLGSDRSSGDIYARLAT